MKKIVYLTILFALIGNANAQVFKTIGNQSIIGNLGIGTLNPTDKLQLGNLNNSENLKISIPGVYNFEQVKLGQYGNGSSGLEFVNHSSSTSSYGIRILSNVDNGILGLQIQTANPSSTYQTLNYLTRLVVNTDGNVGIGTTLPNAKLEVFNTAQSGHLILSANDNGNADLSRIDLDYKIANNNQTIARISSGYPTSANGGSGILRFYTSNSGVLGEKMRINSNGNVSIGTTLIDPTGAMLTVNGSIHTKEVIVDLKPPLADFVFNTNYKLMPLHEVEQFVNVNSHLPEMPSAAVVSKNGLNMGEMQNKLLQKVEELTLYVIEQQKEIEQLKKELKK